MFSKLKQHKRCFHLPVFSILVLSGQLAATLLGKLYCERGGKSKYKAALVQSAGFPILLPFVYITSRKNFMTNSNLSMKLSLAALYIIFGTLLAPDCLLYAVGLKNLPASTFSLICASQLGINSFFFYFLNSQKLTPYVLNSSLLLTTSSTLLVLQSDSTGPSTEGKYVSGFICTISGAAGYALQLTPITNPEGLWEGATKANHQRNIECYILQITGDNLHSFSRPSCQWRMEDIEGRDARSFN